MKRLLLISLDRRGCSPNGSSHRARCRGFSLVEVLMTVGALGILGGVGYVAFEHGGEGTGDTRTPSDLSSLNGTRDANPVALPLPVSSPVVFPDTSAETFMTDGQDDRPSLEPEPSPPTAVVHGTLPPVATAAIPAASIQRATPSPDFETATDAREAATGIDRELAAVVEPGKKPGEDEPIVKDRLPTPEIHPIGGGYATKDYPLRVSVVNRDAYQGIGRIQYQADRGPWTDYLNPLLIQSDRTLSFRVGAVDTENYIDSFSTNDFFYEVPHLLTGGSAGAYYDVEGGPNLVYSLTENDALLIHGTPFETVGNARVESGEANTLQFLHAEFSGIEPGTPFQIGELVYHNGTTFEDSHAAYTVLLIEVGFSDPPGGKWIKFPLDLVNTPNSKDPDASADIARMTYPDLAYPFSLDGRQYELTLKFGDAGANGFTDGRTFYVYEGTTSRVSVMATMTDHGPSSAAPYGDWTREEVLKWFAEAGEKYGAGFGGFGE